MNTWDKFKALMWSAALLGLSWWAFTDAKPKKPDGIEFYAFQYQKVAVLSDGKSVFGSTQLGILAKPVKAAFDKRYIIERLPERTENDPETKSTDFVAAKMIYINDFSPLTFEEYWKMRTASPESKIKPVIIEMK